MKKTFVFVFILSILSTTFLTNNALGFLSDDKERPLKIGYVDILKAVNDSEKGKKARKEWQDLRLKKLDDAKGKRERLDTLKEDLIKQGSILSDDSRRDKEIELDRLEREYKRLLDDSNRELSIKEMELTQDILKEIREIVIELGKKESYAVIVTDPSSDRAGQGGILLYVDEKIDLTEQVIEIYNKRH